jgi:hypothetical protein
VAAGLEVDRVQARRCDTDQNLGLDQLGLIDLLDLENLGPSELAGDDRLQRLTSTR